MGTGTTFSSRVIRSSLLFKSIVESDRERESIILFISHVNNVVCTVDCSDGLSPALAVNYSAFVLILEVHVFDSFR